MSLRALPIRFAAAIGLWMGLVLTGCGYVGPVLPPSPQLPVAIADLVAVQRGNLIEIAFSTPPRTTDSLPIRRFSEVDLRIGPSTTPFDFNTWSESAAQFQLQPPEPVDPDDPHAVPMSKTLPAAEWVGKRVTIAVRTSVKSNDHYSSWSNRVVLNVIPAMTAPLIRVDSTAKGVLVTWTPVTADNVEYRIYRRTATEKDAEIGTSKTPDYLDTTAQYDTKYFYSVVAVSGTAESRASDPKDITPVDVFAPSVPASITALAGPNSIEVSWQRSPEPDLRGYYVFRSVDNGPFTRLGDLLSLPAYSDHSVEHGKTYRYQVSAVDQKLNQSEKSAAAQVSY